MLSTPAGHSITKVRFIHTCRILNPTYIDILAAYRFFRDHWLLKYTPALFEGFIRGTIKIAENSEELFSDKKVLFFEQFDQNKCQDKDIEAIWNYLHSDRLGITSN